MPSINSVDALKRLFKASLDDRSVPPADRTF